MLSSFRRLQKSKAGALIGILFLVTILASFAVADVSNFRSFGGLSQGVLAKVGSESLTEAELSSILQRELQTLRQEKPDATYADLAPRYDAIVSDLLQQRTIIAYAREHGLMPAKKLVDAEIVKIPGVRGLDGRFSQAAYNNWLSQNRLTDAEVRRELTTLLLQRHILTPVVANTRIPLGVARPYASMLLERRDGEMAFIPAAAFRAGPAPKNAELQAFYAQNRQRYMVPEQRVLRIARVGAQQAGVAPPTEQEIAAYYNANRATYGGGETRTLSRASVADRNAAAQIAQRAKAGGAFATAAAPAGFAAADVALGKQSREQLARLAGDQVAAQVFSASAGTVVGPIQSSTGWDVIKVESIERATGRTLQQARGEIVAKLSADKSKEALADLVGRVEDGIADNRTFAEVVAAEKLPVTETPPLTAAGAAPQQPAFKLPADLAAQALKAGFDLNAGDDPVVETLPNDAGYILVAVGDITPASPAPLAQIRDRVAADFVAKRALDKARAVANTIVARGSAGAALPQALAQANAPGARSEKLSVRRLQLTQFGNQIPPPLQILFSLAPGKARLVAAPQNAGYLVVKLDRITPGDATTQPALIAQVQGEFNRASAEEFALQFIAAAQKGLGVERNEQAIADAKRRLLSGG